MYSLNNMHFYQMLLHPGAFRHISPLCLCVSLGNWHMQPEIQLCSMKHSGFAGKGRLRADSLQRPWTPSLPFRSVGPHFTQSLLSLCGSALRVSVKLLPVAMLPLLGKGIQSLALQSPFATKGFLVHTFSLTYCQATCRRCGKSCPLVPARHFQVCNGYVKWTLTARAAPALHMRIKVPVSLEYDNMNIAPHDGCGSLSFPTAGLSDLTRSLAGPFYRAAIRAWGLPLGFSLVPWFLPFLTLLQKEENLSRTCLASRCKTGGYGGQAASLRTRIFIVTPWARSLCRVLVPRFSHQYAAVGNPLVSPITQSRSECSFGWLSNGQEGWPLTLCVHLCSRKGCLQAQCCNHHLCMPGLRVSARLVSLRPPGAHAALGCMSLHCRIEMENTVQIMTSKTIPWMEDNDTNTFQYFCVHCLDSPIGALPGGLRPRRCTSCTVIVQRPSMPLWSNFVLCMASHTIPFQLHLAHFPSACFFKHHCSHLPVKMRALSPFIGVRVGEAQNPGPSQQLLSSYFGQVPRASKSVSAPPLQHKDAIVVAVVNPTSVLHKTNELLALKSDIIMMSETSAVARTQQLMSAALRKHNFRILRGGCCLVPLP